MRRIDPVPLVKSKVRVPEPARASITSATLSGVLARPDIEWAEVTYWLCRYSNAASGSCSRLSCSTACRTVVSWGVHCFGSTSPIWSARRRSSARSRVTSCFGVSTALLRVAG